MDPEFRKSNFDAWGSLNSTSKSKLGLESDYPILVELGNHLLEVHSKPKSGSVIEDLANGVVLCETAFDYFNNVIPISDYNSEIKNDIQIEQNFSAFGAVCEKLQIPRSCIATNNDFQDYNLKKIEVTLVLFVIRAMAYGLKPVSDELAEKLKNYQFDASEKKSDLVICERILSIYRDENNDRDIPVKTPEMESDSSEDKQMDDTQEVDMRPEEAHSEEIDMRPEEANSEEIDMRPEEVKEPESDGEVDEVPLPQPEEPKPAEPEPQPEPQPEDEMVDEVKQEEDLPQEIEGELPVELGPSQISVPPVISDSDSDNEVEDSELKEGPRVVVIPREPEVITQSNDPVGFDVDPHETEEEKKQREEELRKKKEEKEKKKEELVPVPAKEIQFANKTDDLKNMLGKPQKRAVKWYVVALFIVLMLICLVCSIICGVFLAKINN